MSFVKFLKGCVEDLEKDIIVFKYSRYGQSTGASYQGKKLKKPARTSIELPTEICDTNLHDLKKWKMFIIAIPIERWEKYCDKINKEKQLEIDIKG